MKKKQKILIVDDEVFFLQLIKAILDKMPDYEVKALISANKLPAKIDEFAPDIILLDISMPDADGIQVCREIKNSPSGRDIPVVMLSAMCRGADIKRAYEAGADDFLAKPVKREDLIKKIEDILNRS